MAHSHYTGVEPGQVERKGPGAMGPNILYRNASSLYLSWSRSRSLLATSLVIKKIQLIATDFVFSKIHF